MTKGGAIPRTTLQILLALSDGPRHGYGIKLDVEERTEGRVRLGSGTLYEAIQRLLSNEWIVEVPAPDDASGGPARRFYDLSDTGRDVVQRELESMQEIVTFAKKKALFSVEG